VPHPLFWSWAGRSVYCFLIFAPAVAALASSAFVLFLCLAAPYRVPKFCATLYLFLK
jgi:hypothetical protein